MTVYFDNAATTQVCPQAVEAMVKVMRGNYGNPSSTHTMGRNAKKVLDGARQNVAKAMGCSAEEVFFTSGGTESDNWAIRSGAKLGRRTGRHIICSATEHDAVLSSAKELEGQGYEVTFLKPDSNGRITAESVNATLREDTCLVSIMLVNNETGAMNPISDISGLLRKKGSSAIFHCDAVQAFCKVPFSPKKLGVDLLTVSSHKIHGPKGSGALYIRRGLRLPPFITGGGQESLKRGGTEALPAIAGFGEAAKIASGSIDSSEKLVSSLRMAAVETIKSEIPDAIFIGEGDCPYILNLSLPGYRSEVLMNFLEAKDIYVSRSSACKKGARSHVLEAMGLPSRVIDGAIRVSFSSDSTMEQIKYFCRCLKEAKDSLFPAL